jgi:hypothetical protein
MTRDARVLIHVERGSAMTDDDEPLAKLDKIRREARNLTWLVALNVFLTLLVLIGVMVTR